MPASSLAIIVSDAGPLISLGRLDLLALLPALFAQIQVPQQVLDECLEKPGHLDTDRIEAAVQQGWLEVCKAQPLAEISGLGLGERAAIARASEIGAGLLADDQGARKMARSRGLVVIGTLGVLVKAKRNGRLILIAPLIEQLRTSGQRLSHTAVAEALAAAGEGGP